MADKEDKTKQERSTNTPVRPGNPSGRLGSLRPLELARPTHEPHAISNPTNLASPESKKLIVGSEIQLTGNISACDRLIIEGRV